jgi:hypothetical protein
MRIPRHVHAGGLRSGGNRLLPRQKRRSHHDDELRLLLLGVTGFWLCGFALMYGNAGPISNIGGTPPIDGGGAVSLGSWERSSATNGFFLSGNNYDVGVMRCSFSRWCSWIPP